MNRAEIGRAETGRADTMRLDRFLWWARLAKTRSAAQAIASDGHLRLDGRAIDRAHACVRVGNVLTYIAHGRVRVIRVEALPVRRGPAPEAQGCYTDLETANVSQQARVD
ncbi:RNA-binding S4 domain-containing protein [Sphingomonas carotinifaciens]|nr:S4 domain-containing protein [Sphingomonas carotinifaciens]